MLWTNHSYVGKKDAVVSRSFIRMLCHTICSKIGKMKKKKRMVVKERKDHMGAKQSALRSSACLGQ